jgi:membrane protease YdiL (CAAX protease family)
VAARRVRFKSTASRPDHPLARAVETRQGVSYAYDVNAENPNPPIGGSALDRRWAGRRVTALLEVILCSDYPTQIVLGATFAALGIRPLMTGGGLNPSYIVGLSLADAALLIGLIVLFLRAHGEQPRMLFLGQRAVGPEVRAGLPLIGWAFLIALAVLVPIQQFAPWLRTVPTNPLQELIRTPGGAALFAVVVILAGGVREELQRAFLLRRFEQHLGGPRVGLVVSSAAFGAGHLLQGADAAVATAVLGAFWGLIYLRRRSVIAPVVSHAGFNLLQIAQFLTLGR